MARKDVRVGVPAAAEFVRLRGEGGFRLRMERGCSADGKLTPAHPDGLRVITRVLASGRWSWGQSCRDAAAFSDRGGTLAPLEAAKGQGTQDVLYI